MDLSSTSPSNFQIRLDKPMDGRYQVKWTTIPNTLYNINLGNNSFTANGTPLTIPVGNYNGSLLAGELATQLDTLPGPSTPYTVGFNPLTSKLSVTSSDTSATVFLGTGTANKSLGLPPFDTSIDSGDTMPFNVFLGFPLSLGIKVSQSSSCGYVTGGGGYQTTTEQKAVLVAPPPSMGVPVPKTIQTTDSQVYVSSEKQATLLVPLLSEHNIYNWISSHDFNQFVTIEKATKVLNIQVINSLTGAEVDMNGAAWEMLLDRQEDNVSLNKKRRLRESGGVRNI